MSFQRASFVQLMLDHGVVGFHEQPLVLRSGHLSHWYANWRTVTADAFLLEALVVQLLSFVEGKGWKPDCFYGVPEGASKIGVAASLAHARNQAGFSPGSHAVPMGRARPKEHGDVCDRFFVGAPKGRVVMVEDVTTTGDSLLQALQVLEALPLSVVGVVGLLDRQARRPDGLSVEALLAARGIPFSSLLTAQELLPLAAACLKPNPRILTAIEEEFQQWGAIDLHLHFKGACS